MTVPIRTTRLETIENVSAVKAIAKHTVRCRYQPQAASAPDATITAAPARTRGSAGDVASSICG